MTKLDALSVSLTALALMFSVYLSLWSQAKDVILFPTTLLFGGLFLTVISGRQLEHDASIDVEEAKTIGYYTAAALAALTVAGLVSKMVFNPPIKGMNLLTLQYYSVLLAVAEEMFFRGGVLSFLQTYLGSDALAVFSNAAIFAAYHFAVYQQAEALAFVFAGGLILAYVTVKTGRLSPAMLAHVANNLVASGLLGW